MEREQAIALLDEYVSNQSLVRHMLAVEAAMEDYAPPFDGGVAVEASQTDGLGTRKLTTCERALSTFGIGRALLITQNYHLPRALAICAGLGMDAVGVSADLRPYNPRAIQYWETREIPATLVALVEITIAGLR